MTDYENEDNGLHKCPMCNKSALNKGIDTLNKTRLVFCIVHKQQEIPLTPKHDDKLTHEFEFYKGTYLEQIYINTLPDRHKQYLQLTKDNNKNGNTNNT